MSIGLKIKRQREKQGLSQKALALKSKIAPSSLHYIETNQNSPTYSTLKKLAVALNVPLVELVD